MDEKAAHLAERLELGYIRLQENAIDRSTGQRDVVPKQGWYDPLSCSPSGFGHAEAHRIRGPQARSSYRGRLTSAV
jgi:hypothetical protein